MAINLPALPYGKDALAPYLSAATLEFHYGKHHRAYVDNANRLLAGTALENAAPEEIIAITAGDPAQAAVFNNVAQAWNHAFYWRGIKPGGGGPPTGAIAGSIAATWGGYNQFAEEFKNAGATQFGSGWAWLVLDGGALKIIKTANADNPLTRGMKPLLTVDVWEHAYYLDYQNRRPDYLTAFIDKLINWDFVNANLNDER
ncbi:MAG: superoxide dismutase [Pseudomonadota bacterium]|nr:superoxide dismutase [Pseudomonadota bacterium]